MLSLSLLLVGASLAQELPALWISDVSVSGLSSGAFMASQYEVIFSAQVTGSAIIAGGPYFCTEGSYVHVPRCGVAPGNPFDELEDAQSDIYSEAAKNSANGKIDALSNMRTHKVYMFSGSRDVTIDTDVMKFTKKIYTSTSKGFGVPAANVLTDFKSSAGHAWPRDGYGHGCNGVSAPPFIQDCGKDVPATFLRHIVPAGLPNARGTLVKSNLKSFSQKTFISDLSSGHFDDKGYVYIPAACAARTVQCHIHIVFHGCWQSVDAIGTGDDFIHHTGVNEWAETNNIVVLYPQTTFTLSNPLSCWDYVASTGDSFNTKSGKQAAAVNAMVQKLKSGQPANNVGPAQTAPTNAPATNAPNTNNAPPQSNPTTNNNNNNNPYSPQTNPPSNGFDCAELTSLGCSGCVSFAGANTCKWCGATSACLELDTTCHGALLTDAACTAGANPNANPNATPKPNIPNPNANTTPNNNDPQVTGRIFISGAASITMAMGVIVAIISLNL